VFLPKWFIKSLALWPLLLLAIAMVGFGRKKPLLFTIGMAAPIITSPQVSSSFEVSCGPRFNQFPVSYGRIEGYRDFPLIDARNLTTHQSWSNSQAEHQKGLEADPGDVIEISVYFHNGGMTDDCEDDSAIRTLIRVEGLPKIGEAALSHRLSASIMAANAPTVRSSDPDKGGDLTINVRGGVLQTISLIPSSLEERHPKEGAKDTPSHLLDSIFEEGVDLGTVQGGLTSAGFVVFQVRLSAK
jgi:hypothetical protein